MNSLAIQYTVVAVIVVGAIVWMVAGVRRIRKRKGGACCGCALADACNKNKERKSPYKQKCTDKK